MMSEHRLVAILILFNDEGRFLLQHRDPDALRFPDYWGFFGGGFEGGESAEDAVRRELKEELNYNPKDPMLLCVQEYDLLGHQGTRHVFLEKFDASQTLVQREGQGMGWFSEEESRDLLLGEPDRELIRTALEQLARA